MLASFLEAVAPDAEVVAADPHCDRTPERSVSRRARVRHCLNRQGGLDPALETSSRTTLKTWSRFRRVQQRNSRHRRLGLTPTPQLSHRQHQVLTHDDALDAPTVVGIGGAGTRPAHRRHLVGAGALLVLTAVGGGAFAIAGSDAPPAPRHAVMLYNVLSQVREQYDGGFDAAMRSTGLIGDSFDIDADRAAIGASLDAGVDLVVAPAVDFDIAAAAAEHPDTASVAFDQVVPGDNVTSVLVNSHQTSYLAGVAAALVTRNGKVGFIGGVDEEIIWEFAAGFTAGVKATDPTIVVMTEYLTTSPNFGDGYENAPAGEAAGRRLYTAGADVIFATAGKSGLGVFEAAADVTTETGTFRWAIGVDTDQYHTVHELPLSVDSGRWTPHILTSVLKNSDRIVDDIVTDFAHDGLTPGVRNIGLAEGAGDITYAGGFLEQFRDRIEQVRQEILDELIHAIREKKPRMAMS